MNDDPFRDWLADRVDLSTHLANTLASTAMAARADQAQRILARYDAEMIVAATNDAPRTDDPDDRAVYDGAIQQYRRQVAIIISRRNAPWQETVDAIVSLPKPVKGGGDHA